MNARTLIRSSRSIVSCGTSLLISLYQTASSRRAFQTTCLRAVTVHYVKDTRNDKIQRVITTADGRQFTEQENEILHKVFEDIASYSSTTVVNPTENENPETVVKMDNSSMHLVFVYGTLKRNEPNHYLLKDCRDGIAVFKGTAQTVKKWPLVIASRFNIPYLLHCEGKGKQVCGEIYEVDNKMLEQLDKLECHPKYYERIMEEVLMLNERKICKPWIYFLKKYKPQLLDQQCLEDYSSNGPHGLKYVESEETSDPEDIW